jgi:hypothetical protein
MSLDVYVGTLTRYYSGDWQTTVQREYAAKGIDVKVLRPPVSAESFEHQITGMNKRDPAEVRAAIVAWRRDTENALREHHGIEVAFDWDESDAAPHFVQMPQRYCWEALQRWATTHDDDNSPQFDAIRDPIDWWLPVQCPTFGWVTPGDTPITIGSSFELVVALDRLNKSSWQAGEETLGEWFEAGPPSPGTDEEQARFAFSVMMPLAVMSVRHRLPMLMDE